MRSSELTFVAGLHGNELAPLFALHELGLPVVLGNPRAALVRRRFLEKDLNASFATGGNCLEERRALELLGCIPEDRPVIDFHTFSCHSEPFAIVVSREMLPLAACLGLRRVVLISHDIKQGHALIHHRKGVSVEVGLHDSNEAFAQTRGIVSRLLGGGCEHVEFELYETTGIIDVPGDYENFREHPQGFVPVLAGEKAYSHFGLSTRRVA